MSKQQLDYQGVTRSERPTSQVSFQQIVSCSLLGLGVLTALVALVWPHRRWELLGAAISLGATGLVVLLPFRRM